jgi:predicted choloylglycine hydrolase
MKRKKKLIELILHTCYNVSMKIELLLRIHKQCLSITIIILMHIINIHCLELLI